jgi:hypothetical protein
MTDLGESFWEFRRQVLLAIRPARTRNEALTLLAQSGLASETGGLILDRVFPPGGDADALIAGAGPAQVQQAIDALVEAKAKLDGLDRSEATAGMSARLSDAIAALKADTGR